MSLRSRLSGTYHHIRVFAYIPIWRAWDRRWDPVREWAHRRLLAWVRDHVGCNVCFHCCKPYTHREIHWRCNREDMATDRTSNVCEKCMGCPEGEDFKEEWEGKCWYHSGFIYNWTTDMRHVYRTNRDGSTTRLSPRKAKAEARRGIRREYRRIELCCEDPIGDGRFRRWARGVGA